MGYNSTTTKHQFHKCAKMNRKISKPIKNTEKADQKEFKKNKHFHHNRKHKKNCPYSPIHKISQVYRPIYFSDEHKPYMEEQQTKWFYETITDCKQKLGFEQRQSQLGRNIVFKEKNSIEIQQDYKSYIDSNVIMKLLMDQVSKQKNSLELVNKKQNQNNCNYRQNLNSKRYLLNNIEQKDQHTLQLDLIRQIENKMNSINISNR